MRNQRSKKFHAAAFTEYSSKATEYSKRDEEKWKEPPFAAVELSRAMEDLHPKNILDLGVGTGRYFPYINGEKYTGIDISPEMLSHANERTSMLTQRGFQEVKLEVNEIHDFLISAPSEYYDFIFSIGCIGYHIGVETTLFKEIVRVMTPKAHLFLQTTQQSKKYKIKNTISRLKNILLGNKDNSGFFISTSKKQLQKVCVNSGLNPVWFKEDEKLWFGSPLLLSLYQK